MATHELAIRGMDCPDCARTLELGVARLPGVQVCALDFQTEQMRVTYAPEQVDQAAIIARIRALGYDIKPSAPANAPDATASAPQAGRLRGVLAFGAFVLARRASGVPLLVGGALLLVGALLGAFSAPPPLVAGTELLALLVASVPIVRGALQALLLTRRVTIQLLMTLAALGALILGAYAEAATVMVLFALGEALEGFTMQRARDSLRGLTELAPAEALVLVPCADCEEHRGRAGYVDGPCPWCAPHPVRRPVAQVAVGQSVLVQPGERVPLDGLITSGASLVSQQHITGESMPVARGVGEQIYAGSINGDGALELRVSAPAQESLLSRIAALVTQAQSERAPIEQIMERFAAVYTPIIIVLAVLVAALPPLLLGQPFWSTSGAETGWLYRALTLLVIACPCALVISTPVSSVSALSAAARAGVLVKGGAVLAALRKIRVVAFDKTGTLTTGQPQVTQVRCADDCCATARDCDHCDDVLALAAAVETRSAHPLAGAVLRAAERRHVAGRYAAADVTALPGRGVRGQLARGTVTIGSHALFDAEHRHTAALCAQISAAEAHGQTVLMVCACDGGGVQGYLTVADTLRPESQQVIRDLRALGITHTALLTGDTQAAGAQVAQATGVDEVRGALLPADKLGAVRELATRYGAVAMVGDGVNDTPALAAATIGIAMGAAGSAQALATADVALLHDDLTRLPFLLRLSQRADTVIRQNIAVSIGAKVVFLALAVGGWATLWAAIAADIGVALLVIANGMRLLRVRPR